MLCCDIDGFVVLGTSFLGTMRESLPLSLSLPGIDVDGFRMQAPMFLVHPYVKLLHTVNTIN